MAAPAWRDLLDNIGQGPWPQHFGDNGVNHPYFPGPMHTPADTDRIRYIAHEGRFQDDFNHPRGRRRARRNQKPEHYFVRPTDGKRRGRGGMFKDLMTGEGPNVFITSVPDHRHFWDEIPRRAEWSQWTGPMFDVDYWRGVEGRLPDNYPWRRPDGKKYDFFKRKYTRHPGPWSDVHWPLNAGRNAAPTAVRDRRGCWYPPHGH